MTTRQIPPAEAGRNKKKLHPPVLGGGGKRKAAPDGEAGTSKKGKASLPDYLATTAAVQEGRPGGVAAQEEAPSAIVSIRTLS